VHWCADRYHRSKPGPGGKPGSWHVTLTISRCSSLTGSLTLAISRYSSLTGSLTFTRNITGNGYHTDRRRAE
jgi:hypothetical protein